MAVAAALIAGSTSCVKEKLQVTYNSQESKIDQYIKTNKYTDSSKSDSLRVVYNGGSTRLVMTEGTGEEHACQVAAGERACRPHTER